LIGNDREKLPSDRELQRPQDDLLHKWSKRIAELLGQNMEVYVYIHNPFEGHSPASVRRLRERIAQWHPLPQWPPASNLPSNSSESDQLSLF
jgi:uncharacterized protein YecE (DUF72 family)